MGYRDNIPHMDSWVMARPKLGKDDAGEPIRYHGAYPSGFLERAIDYLGVQYAGRVLHVCGGRVKDYHSGPTKGGPGGRGFGPLHRTLDIDPGVAPDFLMDARKLGVGEGDLFPLMDDDLECAVRTVGEAPPPKGGCPDAGVVFTPTLANLWDAALIDRPYTGEDAAKYDAGFEAWPDNLNDLLKRALQIVRPGGRVGVLDYLWPQPPRNMDAKLLVKVSVSMGWNNRERVFVVYERTPTDNERAELFEQVADAYSYVQTLEERSKEADRLTEKVLELESKIEDLWTDEEVEERVEEQMVEAGCLDDVSALIAWGLAAGADPHDVRMQLDDEKTAEALRHADFARLDIPPPRPTPMNIADRQNVVRAAGQVLASAGMTKAEAQRPPSPKHKRAAAAALEGFA